MGGNVHSESVALASYRPTNPAESYNSNDFTAKFRALGIGFFEAFELAVAIKGHASVAVGQKTQKSAEVGKNELGHALGTRCRGIKNLDALGSGIVHIDVVHSNAASPNHFESRTGIHQGSPCGSGRAHQKNVYAFLVDKVRQLLLRNFSGEHGMAGGFKFGLPRGRDSVVCEDFHGSGFKNKLGAAFDLAHHFN